MPKSKSKPKPKAKPKAKAKPKQAKGARKLTPVLYVSRIEPCLDLWVTRLGFTKIVEVPEGDAAGFVILKKGDVEVMYQTMASVAKDVPAFASRATGMSNLYVEVDDIDATERALAGLPLVVPRRTTFYGATEVGVADAAGNVILFAQVGG
jgi:catechol 2,3-dioxygenase-like lactoylglutathione lyase family enzyme